MRATGHCGGNGNGGLLLWHGTPTTRRSFGVVVHEGGTFSEKECVRAAALRQNMPMVTDAPFPTATPGGATTTGPDATPPPPAICQNLRGGGGGGGAVGAGGGGRREGGGRGGYWQLGRGEGGLRATHYYHMHTSRGCLGAWEYRGMYAIIAISCVCQEESLKGLKD